MYNSQYSIYGLNNISGGIRRGETMVIGVHTSSKTSKLNQVIDDIILNCESNNVMSDEEALTQIDKLKKFIFLKPIDFVNITTLNLCVQRNDSTDALISFKKMIGSDNSVRVDVIKSRHEVGSDEDAPENMLRTPFDLVDDFQENKKGIAVIVTPNEQLPKDAHGRTPDLLWGDSPAFRRVDLVKTTQDIDLEEAYPGTRKTNPELYRTSPYPTPEEMITSQNIGMGKLVHVTDKWFFYRHHQFHNIHHKRRKAHFDEISLMLIRFNWVQYKEALHKKKYHIFDKTPRAKAERLSAKRSREKIKSTLMIS